jgi:hypothetical protein
MDLKAHPKVIYVYGGGRLGNQLLNFAHLVAWSADSGNVITVYHVPFWPYASFFAGTSDNRLCRYPRPSGRTPSIVKVLAHGVAAFGARVLQLDPLGSGHGITKPLADMATKLGTPTIMAPYPQQIDLVDVQLREAVYGHSVTLFAGWGFRNWELLVKHQATVRTFFRPMMRYTQIAERFIASLRQQCDILIGVLIRQTDYRQWREGKYFFPTEIYACWMKDIQSWYPAKRVGFVISSDEIQDLSLFSDLNIWLTTGTKPMNGHYFESIVELSMCDLIVSPPSTFSIWAAFAGERPLLPLVNIHQNPTPESVMHGHLFDARLHPQFSESVR